MKDIKFTIVTVCYNAASTIEQTICSVLNQTYKNIEYIIIDGGSTDGTVDIISRYSDKIKWISEPDEGIYDAMNKGIKMASGEYIQFIGSDDCLMNSLSLEQLANIIDVKADVISAAEIIVEEDSRLEFYVGNERGKDVSGNQPPWIPHASMLTRASVMKNILFDTRYTIAADYDFILKCYKNKSIKFQFVDMPIVYFSSGGVSSKRKEIADRENIQILHELGYKTPERTLISTFIKLCKNVIKAIIKAIGLWKWVRCHFLGVVRHKCNNKPCRWCN